MIDQSLPLAIDSTVSAPADSPVVQPAPMPLRQYVQIFVWQQLQQLFLQSAIVTDFYDLVMAEIEAPMLEIILQYTNQNQSETARLMALSRGTLRKKMQRYGLLPIAK